MPLLVTTVAGKNINKCLYPALLLDGCTQYTKTGTRDTNLAIFYKTHQTFGAKHIYDFLTILNMATWTLIIGGLIIMILMIYQ